MANNKNERINAWARLLESGAGLIGKVLWSAVAVICFGAVGRYLFVASRESADRSYIAKTTAPIREPIAWREVDLALVDAFRSAHQTAELDATAKLDVWSVGLERRIDEDFLEWYFSYAQQQWIGLKAIGYWATEKLLDDQPTVGERISGDIQEEFAKRVLRPQIAQMQIERVADETITAYVAALQESVSSIPDAYDIPQAEWDRYLADISMISQGSEGKHQIPLSLKTLTTASVVGGAAGAVKLTQTLRPAIAKIGTKVSSKAAGAGAAKAAAKLASKTGAKTGAKAGGKFLGPVIGAGIIAWDVWDHHHTKKIERPILRRNLVDYLDEMKRDLLHDPESGMMTLLSSVEARMVASLPAREVEPATRIANGFYRGEHE